MDSGVIRSKPKLGITLEKNTEAVPQDGKFHVVVDGEIVFSSSVLSAAQIEYEERVEEMTSTSRATLTRESEHYNLQAVRSDSFARRASNSNKKGGRGGRGGV